MPAAVILVKNCPDPIRGSVARNEQGSVRVVMCQHDPLQKELFVALKRLFVHLLPSPEHFHQQELVPLPGNRGSLLLGNDIKPKKPRKL